MSWKDYPIFKREDGSYVIVQNESPYHVPNEGEWAALHAEVSVHYEANEAARAVREVLYEDLHPEELPPPLTSEELAAQALAEAKAERANLVEKSTVEIDGMVFNADETSQNRLSRGITAALALGLGPDETTEWTLADDSSAMVTVRQMARALLAAGQYQTSVWRKPYEV